MSEFEEIQAKMGCALMVLLFAFVFVIDPAAYGGAVQIIFGITDMSYGQKLLGGFSGLGIPAYLVSETLEPYFPTPFVKVSQASH